MTTRTCRSRAAILARLSAYLDGEIPAAECATLKRHCRECSRCRTLVGGLCRAVGMCRRAGAAPLPAVVRKRARQSVRRLLSA